MARRRRFSRIRRSGGRFRRGVRRHPKLVTRLANGVGLLIAFNQEIGSASRDFQSGLWQSNPQQALSNLTYRATGFDPVSGNFSAPVLTASVGSKIGGYVFAKIVKALVKRMKVM